MTVELPRDAEGREIPLNTTALYDKNGSRRQVDWFKFYPDKDRWDIVFKDSYSHFSPHNLSLTKPDSWEKLLDDLDKGENICDYFENCPDEMHGKSCSYCNKAALKDIASRIRKLRGED